MNSGWKTVLHEGPHYFQDGRSLCGFFTVRKQFKAEKAPKFEDTCTKCWRLREESRNRTVFVPVLH